MVCALFIPEAWFGNVQTMEPIILKGLPPERFNKVTPFLDFIELKVAHHQIWILFSPDRFATSVRKIIGRPKPRREHACSVIRMDASFTFMLPGECH